MVNRLFRQAPLPAELITEIMKWALNYPAPVNHIGRQHFLFLRAVCRSWRSAAFGARILWRSLEIHMNCHPDLRHIRAWFARAGPGAPLNLVYNLPMHDCPCRHAIGLANNDEELLAFAAAHPYHKITNWHHRTLYAMVHTPFTARKGLEELLLSHSTQWKNLALSGEKLQPITFDLSLILPALPQLQPLHIAHWDTMWEEHSAFGGHHPLNRPVRVISHSGITALHLRSCKIPSASLKASLSDLALPALSTLILDHVNTPDHSVRLNPAGTFHATNNSVRYLHLISGQSMLCLSMFTFPSLSALEIGIISSPSYQTDIPPWNPDNPVIPLEFVALAKFLRRSLPRGLERALLKHPGIQLAELIHLLRCVPPVAAIKMYDPRLFLKIITLSPEIALRLPGLQLLFFSEPLFPYSLVDEGALVYDTRTGRCVNWAENHKYAKFVANSWRLYQRRSAPPPGALPPSIVVREFILPLVNYFSRRAGTGPVVIHFPPPPVTRESSQIAAGEDASGDILAVSEARMFGENGGPLQPEPVIQDIWRLTPGPLILIQTADLARLWTRYRPL